MINLLFAGNSKVFDGVFTCLLSILNRSKKDTYHVYLLTMSLTEMREDFTPISESLVTFLRDFLKAQDPENEVTCIHVDDLYKEHFHGCPNESAYCSPYTLIRLLADLLPEIPSEKLLYLDTDIMFNRDVHLLYDQDIEGYEYAAGRDHYGKYLIQPNYINAGVLLFNMEECRKTGIFGKSRDWLRKKKLTFADQSALIRSTTRKKMLPQKFNDQKFLHKSTVVRHFSKRLFWLPYPHTANIKQYHIEQVHKVFRYHQFDDVYEVFLRLKEMFEKEGVYHD